MKKKSIKPWIVLIVAPIPLIVGTAILQMIARFALSGADGGSTAITTIINIMSLLVGMVSVLAIFCLPIWIIMLVITVTNNKKWANNPKNNYFVVTPTTIPLFVMNLLVCGRGDDQDSSCPQHSLPLQ